MRKSAAAVTLEWQITEFRLHAGDLTARVYPGPGRTWRWTVHQQGPAGWSEKERGDGATAEDAMGRAQAAIGRIS